MRDYERVLWETPHSQRNTRALGSELSGVVDAAFENAVLDAAGAPGPLNVCLARAYSDPNWDCKASHVVGRFLARARSIGLQDCPQDILNLLTPLLRWDYGWEPIAAGLDELDGSFSSLVPTYAQGDVANLLNTAWLLGLLALACPGPARRSNLDALRADLDARKHGGVGWGEVADGALSRIAKLWRPTAGRNELAREHELGELWQFALVSAIRHQWIRGGDPDLYARLLLYVEDGGSWPPCWPKNQAFIEKAVVRGCEGFWAANPCLRRRDPFVHQVEFLTDPIEMLNTGSAFDTCARLEGIDERSILAYAANANYRIAVVRANDGRIMGRRVIGLRIFEEGRGVLKRATYPHGHGVLEECLDCFLEAFLDEAGLVPLDPDGGRGVEKTCAAAYNKGWIPWNA